MRIDILLADDHESSRLGIHYLVERMDMNIAIVGEAPNGRIALEMVAELQPNIVIMDIGMPEVNGIEATRIIKQNHPYTKVIALSMYKRKTMIVDMLKAGASGYILKESVAEDLIPAIKAAMSDNVYLSTQVNKMIASDYVSGSLPEAQKNASQILSPRERTVLQLLAEGHHVKEIAQSLGVSPKTIESIRSRITKKLGISNLAQLTRYAIREGLTVLDC